MSNNACGGCEAICVSSCIGICAMNCSGSATTNAKPVAPHNVSIPTVNQINIRGDSVKVINNLKVKR